MSSDSMPAYLRFHVYNVFSQTPWLWQTSRTVTPSVIDDKIFTICSSLKRDFFILTPSSESNVTSGILLREQTSQSTIVEVQ